MSWKRHLYLRVKNGGETEGDRRRVGGIDWDLEWYRKSDERTRWETRWGTDSIIIKSIPLVPLERF